MESRLYDLYVLQYSGNKYYKVDTKRADSPQEAVKLNGNTNRYWLVTCGADAYLVENKVERIVTNVTPEAWYVDN